MRLLRGEDRRPAALEDAAGPRTTEAGLLRTTWPTTSQSNSMRTAARCCLTEGAACDVPSCST